MKTSTNFTIIHHTQGYQFQSYKITMQNPLVSKNIFYGSFRCTKHLEKNGQFLQSNIPVLKITHISLNAFKSSEPNVKCRPIMNGKHNLPVGSYQANTESDIN